MVVIAIKKPDLKDFYYKNLQILFPIDRKIIEKLVNVNYND